LINKSAFNHEFTKQHQRVIERLEYIKPGENAWTAKLPAHLELNVSGARISQIYKRLDPTKPSYTVTGSGGGGTHVYHWIENRALTNRERARLQTFPDTFHFQGSKESVRRQIGMAVPPDGARVIFDAIKKTLDQIPYSTVPSNFKYNAGE
jgi:DNA (cytosine-5)-methyltransferase 1